MCVAAHVQGSEIVPKSHGEVGNNLPVIRPSVFSVPNSESRGMASYV